MKYGTVFDGQDFHAVPTGEGLLDWIRRRSTAELQRLLSGTARFVDVDARAVRRWALQELLDRRPAHERALAAGNAAAARRRWVTLFPVFTNYSNGDKPT